MLPVDEADSIGAFATLEMLDLARIGDDGLYPTEAGALAFMKAVVRDEFVREWALLMVKRGKVEATSMALHLLVVLEAQGEIGRVVEAAVGPALTQEERDLLLEFLDPGAPAGSLTERALGAAIEETARR